MRRHLPAILAVMAVAALLLVPAALSWRAHVSVGGTPKAARHVVPQLATASADQVVVDSTVGEVFVPSATAPAPLTADAAFSRYASINGSGVTAPASGVTVELGYLTLPVGAGTPGEYVANHELVWSFHWPACPPSTLPGGTAPTSTCVEWLFLDAATGAQIDQTWQQ